MSRKSEKKLLFALFVGILFSGNALAGLISYRAARFARGLTGASAFAAGGYLSFNGFRNGLNHIDIS